MTVVVIVLSLFDANNITAIHWVCLIFNSLGSLFVFNVVVSLWPSLTLYGVATQVLAEPQVWVVMLLCVGSVCMLEITFRGLKNMLRPTLTTVLQERNLYWSIDQKTQQRLRMSEQEEVEWLARKPAKRQHIAAHMRRPDDFAEDDHLKGAVRVILRFRNLTGGQFESAASHLYQKHDRHSTVSGTYHGNDEDVALERKESTQGL
jgi:hypothetical protein